MHEVLSIILGGGAGTRLYPLTRERAKPAVPLGGKYRLIDIPISNCLNSGLNRIFVLTQYLSASLNRHISWTYNNLGIFSRGWVQILAAEQAPGLSMVDSWYQGTADAVRKQMIEIESAGCEQVLILSGDHLYRMDYNPFLTFHRQSQADVTIAVQPVGTEQAPRLGLLAADEKGEIVDFAEKPSDPVRLQEMISCDDPQKPYLASMGIYIFDLSVLRELLNGCSDPDFGLHIIPQAIERYKVCAHTFEGFWADIGTIRSFYEVNLMLAQPGMPFSFYDEQYPIFTHPRFLPPVRIDDCVLEHALISEGSQLCEARIAESVIGVRSVIGCDTDIKRTMMMGADYYDDGQTDPRGTRHDIPLGIGEGCRIEGAILDKNVRIGPNVTINAHSAGENMVYPPGSSPGEETYVIRDGIVVIPKNTEIPAGMVI
jgi:glucose-1-phosphate adenylyltransferase